MNHNSNMNAGGESDGRVLPGKHPNKDGNSSAEVRREDDRPRRTRGRRPRPDAKLGNALDGLQRVRKQQRGISGYDSLRYYTTYP